MARRADRPTGGMIFSSIVVSGKTFQMVIMTDGVRRYTWRVSAAQRLLRGNSYSAAC